MSVQFNLLPDVKLEFARQQRNKRTVYTLSALACIVVGGVFILSFVLVNVLQKELLNKTQDDIKTYSNKLKNIKDLDKVLTIQNQLNALPKLHQGKHITSRFFDYLPKVTPQKIYIGQVQVDFNANTLTINGTSDKLETINAFVDTLKFTKLKTADSEDQRNAFTDVVLSNSGRSDKGASYAVNAVFDSALFDNNQTVTLIVPQEVTTRSVTQSPDLNSLLFNGDTGIPKDKQGTQ